MKLLYSIIIPLLLGMTLLVGMVKPLAANGPVLTGQLTAEDNLKLINAEQINAKQNDQELESQEIEQKEKEELEKKEKEKKEQEKKEQAQKELEKKQKEQAAKAAGAQKPAAKTTVASSSKKTSTTATSSASKSQPASKPASTNTPQSNAGSKASALVNTAKQYLGVKYLWGGTTPDKGFDCSGYVKYVYEKHGITLPRVSRDQYNTGTAVAFANLQMADLVFFSFDGDKVTDHVGIYIGNGQFIHASSSKGVTISSFSSYWQSRYLGAKRIL